MIAGRSPRYARVTTRSNGRRPALDHTADRINRTSMTPRRHADGLGDEDPVLSLSSERLWIRWILLAERDRLRGGPRSLRENLLADRGGHC
jgi:hypothetical protein